MAVCHKGHDIKLLGYGRSFCDCGAGGCLLSQHSLVLAEQCLIGNSRGSLGLDEEGRVLGTKESNLVITPFEVCIRNTILPLNSIIVFFLSRCLIFALFEYDETSESGRFKVI